jgi:uncharacterized radical SAM protein YgiQ
MDNNQQYIKRNHVSPFLPTTKDEMLKLGWQNVDVVLFSGDAYVDHPAFGAAVIARVLEHNGYRVAVVPQPNWRDDLRDFKKMGVPRLFFAITSGAMDSMVNHYTAAKRLRSNDAYTPNGAASFRPDYAVKTYSLILKKLYPDVPVVIGGIEASLRRLAHYDYWQDKLMPSILLDSKADFLIYGMGEKAIVEIADYLRNKNHKKKEDSLSGEKENFSDDRESLKQIAYFSKEAPKKSDDVVLLHSFDECVKSKRAFIENFNEIELQANIKNPRRIAEPCGGGYVYVNVPFDMPAEEELDSYHDLPYTRLPHPRYKGKMIPAYEMIKFSINIHRGCFGGCSFCTIAAHQGKFIQSRSCDSILREIEKVKALPGFAGNISDVGGPTANMYRMGGKDKTLCEKCRRKSCLFPVICSNLNNSHKSLLELYHKIDALPGIKHSYIGSGIRYDLFLSEKGFYDNTCRDYFYELMEKHTSGRLKVAPEHTEDEVLKQMGKPSFKLFERLREEFDLHNRKRDMHLQLVPYFISSHPGCTMADMQALAHNKCLRGVYMDQVQDFTPTPMTRSSVSYYTGLDTRTFRPIPVEKNPQRKKEQKSYFFKK